MELNRREFMAAAGAVVATAGMTSGAAEEPKAQSVSWYDRPMRWMQLVLVEDDPGQYEPDWWLDLFSRVHADAACLSAAGAWRITRRRLSFTTVASG
jgi:hypothetical protein